MNVAELLPLIDAQARTGNAGLDHSVTGGRVCDLLSRVLARGQAGDAWITVQTHMNVVAVAVLRGIRCVIVPEAISVPADVAAKAGQEGIAILSSPLTAFEICARLHKAGISAR